MQSLLFLNSKARRDFVERLQNMYGFHGELKGQLLRGAKDKIYLLEDSDIIRQGRDKELRIDRVGLKIATETLGGPRMNVEGSQLIGPHCSKRVLEIDPEHLEPLVKGEDFLLSDNELQQTGGASGLFMLKLNRDFMGSCIVKDGRVWNQLSKIRRVKNLNH